MSSKVLSQPAPSTTLPEPAPAHNLAQTPKLTSRTVRVTELCGNDVREMYDVFQTYYDESDIVTFLDDLEKKESVILLCDKTSQKIVGFTTLGVWNFEHQGKKVVGVFSGDTILEKAYWGNKSWQAKWIWWCLKKRIRYFYRPMYWLLISKGYKTYLLLANNFSVYYPATENRHRQLKPLVDTYSRNFFPWAYNPDLGILDFGEKSQCLKSHVAQIDESTRSRNAHIRLFETLNPEWHRGVELPCIAKIQVRDAFKWLGKTIGKTFGTSKH